MFLAIKLGNKPHGRILLSVHYQDGDTEPESHSYLKTKNPNTSRLQPKQKKASCDIKTLSLLTLNLTHLDRNENTDYVCFVI